MFTLSFSIFALIFSKVSLILSMFAGGTRVDFGAPSSVSPLPTSAAASRFWGDTMIFILVAMIRTRILPFGSGTGSRTETSSPFKCGAFSRPTSFARTPLASQLTSSSRLATRGGVGSGAGFGSPPPISDSRSDKEAPKCATMSAKDANISSKDASMNAKEANMNAKGATMSTRDAIPSGIATISRG